MGTPEIAVRSLTELAAKYEVVGLFCGEDKPVGRKYLITPPATKLAAMELGIPVFQPATLKNESTIQLVKELNPDLIVVVAYGKLLPKALLDIPRFGAINVHASMLPAYRGASPIQYALINSEEKTGVTIMQLDSGLDTGDIIKQREIVITDSCDAISLFTRVSSIAAELLLETVEMFIEGRVEYIKQDDSKVSYAPTITKEMGVFSFSEDAKRIVGLVKGLQIWPGAYFLSNGRKIKVQKASLSDLRGEAATILSLKPLTVAAKDGSVVLLEVKPENKGVMSGTAFAAGLRLVKGDMIV